MHVLFYSDVQGKQAQSVTPTLSMISNCVLWTIAPLYYRQSFINQVELASSWQDMPGTPP